MSRTGPQKRVLIPPAARKAMKEAQRKEQVAKLVVVLRPNCLFEIQHENHFSPVPLPLQGQYTSETAAHRAIENYLATPTK